MRAMVAKMTRSIEIGKDEIEWGCRVINSKYNDFDSGT